jgi:DNA-binding transcriptional ArsR family regulator
MSTLTHYERAEALSAELLAAHERGESVSSLAVKYDLRREAIAAELSRHGIGAPSPAREAVLAYVREHRGLSVDDLALRLDLSKSSVSRYLRDTPEHKLVVSRKNAPVQKFTDAQMAAALKTAFRQLDDRSQGLSRKKYRELTADVPDAPAAPTFIRRFGSWSEACRACGITSAKARRTNYVQEFTDESIVEAVTEYITSTGKTSFHGYTEWARENGRPSGPLLVQRLGGWAEARRMSIAADAA